VHGEKLGKAEEKGKKKEKVPESFLPSVEREKGGNVSAAG